MTRRTTLNQKVSVQWRRQSAKQKNNQWEIRFGSHISDIGSISKIFRWIPKMQCQKQDKTSYQVLPEPRTWIGISSKNKYGLVTGTWKMSNITNYYGNAY